MDVRSLNLCPYCHISLPYITKFVVIQNHQRSQPVPSNRAICQDVECLLLLLLLLMSLFLNVGACVYQIAMEGQSAVDHNSVGTGERIQIVAHITFVLFRNDSM